MKTLIKMKCCVFLFAMAVTGVLLIMGGGNIIHAGISGTVALLYGIGLLMLSSIAIYDKIVNRHHRTEAAEVKAGSI
jgi:hypothetical protein